MKRIVSIIMTWPLMKSWAINTSRYLVPGIYCLHVVQCLGDKYHLVFIAHVSFNAQVISTWYLLPVCCSMLG